LIGRNGQRSAGGGEIVEGDRQLAGKPLHTLVRIGK